MKKVFSKTINWFDLKQCMNQVSNANSSGPLVYDLLPKKLGKSNDSQNKIAID